MTILSIGAVAAAAEIISNDVETFDDDTQNTITTNTTTTTTNPISRELSPANVKVALYIFSLVEDENNDEYLALLIDDKLILRNSRTGYVNGSKLLSDICGLTRRETRNILTKEDESETISLGNRYLRGTWIPLVRARYFAHQYNIKHVLWPLLHNDPSWFVGTEFYANLHGSFDSLIAIIR